MLWVFLKSNYSKSDLGWCRQTRTVSKVGGHVFARGIRFDSVYTIFLILLDF
jgi:hypothetical protein